MLTEVVPAGTVTALGTLAMVGPELVRFTVSPPSGTGSEKYKVQLRWRPAPTYFT